MKKFITIFLVIILFTFPVIGATVGSIHTTDTDFNSGTLSNTKVVGSGSSANVELKESTGFTDGFEDGDTNGWTVDVGSSFTAQTSVVHSGTYAAEYSASNSWNGGVENKSITGSQNVTISAYIQDDSGDSTDNDLPWIAFRDSSDDSQYVAHIQTSGQPALRIREVDSSGNTQDVATSSSNSYSLNTFYNITFTRNMNTGEMWVVARNSNDVYIDSISGTDNTISPDIYAVGSYRNTPYFDDITIKDGSISEGYYISDNHQASNVESAFVNLTISNNAYANVTVLDSSNTVINTANFSSTGNHTIDITSSTDNNHTIRVDFNEINGDIKLHDEGILVSSATPTPTPTSTPTSTSTGLDTQPSNFNKLISPNDLTIPLTIFISGILLIIAFIGIKLRNAIVIFVWGLAIISLMLVILIGFDFIWFWILIILSGLSIGISSIYRYLIYT